MKTNFEVWKDRLTPEYMAQAIEFVKVCLICPAFNYFECNSGKKCHDIFAAWANEEVPNE